jgi:hypothetical protein
MRRLSCLILLHFFRPFLLLVFVFFSPLVSDKQRQLPFILSYSRDTFAKTSTWVEMIHMSYIPL